MYKRQGHQQSGNSGLEAVGPGASTKKAKVAGGTSGVSTHIAEYQLTMKIAKSLKKELVNRGYAVVMTRTKNNVNISNKERAIKINKSGADIYIRIHGDSSGSRGVKGASIFYPSARNPYVSRLSRSSKRLSKKLLNAYCKKTGIKKRGCSGSIKAYGVRRIALRKKDSLLKGRITIYYTKGFINFDPADLKGFVACAKERNPHADYREE